MSREGSSASVVVTSCHSQLGVLTPQQLAAAKVLELVLEEALSHDLCSRHAACASAEIRLLSEARIYDIGDAIL